MSAYVVDPATIDYVVAWVQQQHGSTAPAPKLKPAWEVPPEWSFAISTYSNGLELQRLSPNALGGYLMNACVKSVQYRYPDCSADDLPGLVDQRRVWRYQHQRPTLPLSPLWVARQCDCIEYQSCEVPDYYDTLAYAMLAAIREAAVFAAIEATGAPWGIESEVGS